jgi:hypothetical protein
MKIKLNQISLTEIPHEGKKINFRYPPYKGFYGEVTEKIDKEHLKRPSSSKIASLIYDAWESPREKNEFENNDYYTWRSIKGEYESAILQSLDKSVLWEYTGNLFVPKSSEEINNGVIIEHNPKIINRELIMDKNSLIKRLKENDPLVKFVPYGFKRFQQSFTELEKNPYILARYGEEGASKIAKVASRLKNPPLLYIFDNKDKERARISSLGRMSGEKYRLNIFCDLEDWFNGHAFGICKKQKEELEDNLLPF